MKKTWDNLEQGDLLCKAVADQWKVQGWVGKILFTTQESTDYVIGAKIEHYKEQGFHILEEVLRPEPETIELDGNTYDKEEVMEAIKELKPV
jgi:hypothetical protein